MSGHHNHNHHDGGGGGGDTEGNSNAGMAMVWNWRTSGIYVVFDFWVTTGPFSTLVSCIAVFLLACGYEWYRENRSRYDRVLVHMSGDNNGGAMKPLGGDSSVGEIQVDDESLLESSRGKRTGNRSFTQRQQMIRAVLYAIEVFSSFMLMLIFMTYNGWINLALVTGAGTGFYLQRKTAVSGVGDKSAVCH
ncbi:Ctr copper transporter family-domain-containing protein [Cladochytrium replicatum]|nr:Ctr copper transporter family-domain-containing protein [Cladochytrium replicatum]